MPIVPNAAFVASLCAGDSVTLVNGATGAGASPIRFSLAPKHTGGTYLLSLQAIRTGTFTSLLANVEQSTDFGNSWNTVRTGIDFVRNPISQVMDLAPGPIFRLNITQFAGGTSVVVNGVPN